MNKYNALTPMKSYWMLCIIAIAIVVISSAGCTQTTQNATSANETIGGITLPTTTGSPTPAEAQQIAAAAYVFGYPLVLMDITKDLATALPAPAPDGHAPINQFGNVATSPDASFTAVVSPNVDTLYSAAWLNLSKEPMVVECAQYERAVLPDADALRLDGRLCITREAHHRNRRGELRHRRPRVEWHAPWWTDKDRVAIRNGLDHRAHPG